VKQVTPGARLRISFHCTRTPCGCEDCAADLWLRLAPTNVQAAAVELAAAMLLETGR
jgi:hypothetical protein